MLRAWVSLGVLATFVGCSARTDSSSVGTGSGTTGKVTRINTVPDPNDASSAKSSSPFASAVAAISGKKRRDTASESGGESQCSSFVDIAAERHLDHTYQNGARGLNLMVEATGGGCGWLDYDNDGYWDLYLNQGGNPAAAADSNQPSDALFRNLSGKDFRAVAELAGIREFAYGQGLAVGDYDADGWDDIYVTNVGTNTLFHNLGDGTFENVTLPAGVAEPRWSSSAAFADLNGDGWLDLYVCNYCDYDPHNPIICQRNNEPLICHPKDVPPVADEFFLNRGDGTFAPEAAQRGLQGPMNRALGVVIADFDDDGDLDLLVGNDTTANFLFDNDGTGLFTEVATTRGIAVDRNGATRADMGLAAGDFDGDGWLDICSTNFYREGCTLYRNLGKAWFEDVTGVVGLHLPTLTYLGWGTVMADFNQDGFQELFITNGHIDPTRKMDGSKYEMESQLFRFDGDRWHECTKLAGDYFRHRRLGRGVAACDFDNDGDLDLCVVHQNSPVGLLENRSPSGHWLQVRLVGTAGNRRGVGAKVIVRAGERTYTQQLAGGTSYGASHQPILTFGLGKWDSACDVEIRWPDGKTETLANVPPDQRLVCLEPQRQP